MADRLEDLFGPEWAALDAWNRVSPDTTGMLYAVRAALAHLQRSEDARLAVAERQIAAVRAFVDSYPPVPTGVEVGADPEMLIVQRLRGILNTPTEGA